MKKDATEDEGDMATEDADVQIGDIEPIFKSVMAICHTQHKRELELDLWNNRPTTKDEATERAILLQALYFDMVT